MARRCVWSRNLENEEAKARYRAVKIQSQWVVTSGKQTNIRSNDHSFTVRMEIKYEVHCMCSCIYKFSFQVQCVQPATEPGWLANSCSVSQQLGALQTHITDTFRFISHTTNVLLFKFRCNIFIGVRIINILKPNDIYIYICRTAALTSRRYILNIYSTNIQPEYFKHAA